MTITINVIITGEGWIKDLQLNEILELFADDVCLEERGVRSDIPTDNSPNKQFGEKKMQPFSQCRGGPSLVGNNAEN